MPPTVCSLTLLALFHLVPMGTDALPAPKQAMYNYQRNARVMIKELT